MKISLTHRLALASIVVLGATYASMAGAAGCTDGSPINCGGPNIVDTYTTATLTASPTSITQGASSLLTWSTSVNPSSGTALCSGNFNMGGQYYNSSSGMSYVAPGSGSVYVSPTETKTYTIDCWAPSLGSVNHGTASATVTVKPGFFSACSVSPTTAKVGETVTWTATDGSGGTPPYTYTWAGTDVLAGKTGQVVKVAYTSPGMKGGKIFITDSGTSQSSSYTRNKTPRSKCTGPIIPGYGESSVEDYPYVTGEQINPMFWLEETNSSPPDFPSNTNYCVQLTMHQQGGCPIFNQTNCIPYTSINVDWHQGSGTRLTTEADYPFPYGKNNTQPATAFFASMTFKPSHSSTPDPKTTAMDCSNSVTISEADGPDLTASAVAPTSAPANTQTTLSALVSNTGTKPTGKGFSDFFQEAPNYPDEGGEINLGTYASAALDADDSNTASISHSFSAGIHYVRACADKISGGDAGVIAESDEDNNCGEWTKIIVRRSDCPPGDPSCVPTICDTHPTDPSCNVCFNNPELPSCNGFCATHPTAPACTDFCKTHPSDINCKPKPGGVRAFLNADPLSIVRGFSSTLTWSSEGATSCAGTPALLFNTHNATEGETPVFPLLTTLFTLECKDDAGHKATDAQNIEVTEPVLSLTATPMLVRKGETTALVWFVKGKVDSCSMKGPGVNSAQLSGTAHPVIDAESTYILSCDAGSYHPSKSVTVKVAPSYKEI